MRKREEERMADDSYDIVIGGGGLGGSALAKVMAENGKRTLVLEKETQFRDRVRGEGLVPWGGAEAEQLGCYRLLCDSCAMLPVGYRTTSSAAPNCHSMQG
jgi:2-polyprenyl-6-methoxyphenol hydroxylase-like FAD-dependent oxidoreductase